MKNIKVVLALVAFIVLVTFFSFVIFVKFPLPSTDVDYFNKKLTDRLGVIFEIKNLYRDIFGNVFFDVSYLPEFYAGKVRVSYDDLLKFLSSGDKISFSVESNSINFADLSSVIGYLGLNDDERFLIATNVVNEYLKRISNTTISNLIVSKDVFYKHNDKFINAFVDVSVRMSKMELEVSKDIGRIKKEMEEYFNNFREDSYKEYLQSFSKGKAKVSSDIFVQSLDKGIKNLKDKLISYQKKVDDVYSKLSILKEGYKVAWDERIKMIKSEPQRYIDRYITVFPYYLMRKLIKYVYVDVPKVLQLKNVKYVLSSSNGVIYFTLRGEEFKSGYKIYSDVVISNSVWYGFVKYYNFEGNETYLDSSKKIVVLNYVFKPFMDTLNGEYSCNFIYSPGFNITNFVYSTLTNSSTIDRVVSYMFTEEGFVESFIEEEVDNLFRSYVLQYERYRDGILKDVNKLKREFHLEVEKEKMKLRKSY